FNANIFPKVICVEYNAKWGINANVKVNYEPSFVWAGDDYTSVSINTWQTLFATYNYTLLCCDMAGNNAFFIRNDYKHLFTLYSSQQLYQPARYYLTRRRSGHPSTLKMLKDIVQ
ncbi:MAG TPA: hypothetical protein VN958_02980, partial [Chitinophagaceae bacterium]|nr:hypothetical protein [Chitinophagaceae bacterium]